MITSAEQVTRYLAVVQEHPENYRAGSSDENDKRNPRQNARIFVCPSCNRRRTLTLDQLRLIHQLAPEKLEEFRPKCPECREPMNEADAW